MHNRNRCCNYKTRLSHYRNHQILKFILRLTQSIIIVDINVQYAEDRFIHADIIDFVIR